MLQEFTLIIIIYQVITHVLIINSVLYKALTNHHPICTSKRSRYKLFLPILDIDYPSDPSQRSPPNYDTPAASLRARASVPTARTSRKDSDPTSRSSTTRCGVTRVPPATRGSLFSQTSSRTSFTFTRCLLRRSDSSC